jgi:hypothetical protein
MRFLFAPRRREGANLRERLLSLVEGASVTMFTNIFTCVLGVAFMFFAFYATGMRGALSHRGPTQPISTAGRAIFFLAGAAVFVDACNKLFADTARSHPWWLRAALFAIVTLIAIVLNARRVRAYFAGRVTGRPDIAIKFNGGLPAALLAMRIAFIAVVLVMAVFGFAPIRTSVARDGIVACVLALFLVGFSYMFIESHYIDTGRASVIKLSDEQPPNH